MARSGGVLFDTLSSLRSGGSALSAAGVDLSSLNGKDTDVVIEAIANALAPQNGDGDRIRVAIIEALSECLEGVAQFDFSRIDDEMVVAVMLAYTRNCLFEQIILDSRDAFAKAQEAGRVEQAERALCELIAAATDLHMRPLLSGQLAVLNGPLVEAAQIKALAEIWAVWEGFEP
jgi:hypothetical protein